MHLGSIQILVQDSSDWVLRNFHMRITNASLNTLWAPSGMCTKVGTLVVRLVFRMVFRAGIGPCTVGKNLCNVDSAGAASSGIAFGV